MLYSPKSPKPLLHVPLAIQYLSTFTDALQSASLNLAGLQRGTATSKQSFLGPKNFLPSPSTFTLDFQYPPRCRSPNTPNFSRRLQLPRHPVRYQHPLRLRTTVAPILRSQCTYRFSPYAAVTAADARRAPRPKRRLHSHTIRPCLPPTTLLSPPSPLRDTHRAAQRRCCQELDSCRPGIQTKSRLRTADGLVPRIL